MLPLCRREGGTFKWLQGSLNSVSSPNLPSDFDWRAYLKWNPELELQGIHTRQAAEEHYVTEGHLKSLVYRDFELTIRYTACGGLMNQHYCHIATITLAHLAKADKIIWPPMQVRCRCQCLHCSFNAVVMLSSLTCRGLPWACGTHACCDMTGRPCRSANPSTSGTTLTPSRTSRHGSISMPPRCGICPRFKRLSNVRSLSSTVVQ